jgi:hypothetical protein
VGIVGNPLTRSPAAGALAEARDPWPPQWMVDLERAHDQLRHGARLLENGAQPVIDLAPAARALEKTFGAIYDAFDERQNRLHATRAALASLDQVVGALTPGASLDAAIGFSLEYLREAKKSLLAADERLVPLVARPRGAAPDIRASIDVPRLHEVDRPSLMPLLKVPGMPPPEVEPPALPPIGKPQTFEELKTAIEELKKRAEARSEAREKRKREEQERQAEERAARGEEESPKGFVPEIPPAISEPNFLHQRVRECFEEVAMIGMQRAPLLGDPWRSSLVLERRMLAALDAIAAMGPPALAALEPLVLDAPAKDPSRVFGIAMVLGCLAGRDALAAAERVFLAFELSDPEHAVQLAGALKLVPHPLLPLTIRTFLGDSDPAHRALAIDVLAYRGMASADELARAAMDAPEVRIAALPWFALTGHPGVREAIDGALASDDIAVREAAWHAMAVSGHPQAGTALRRELEGDHAERAALALSVIGDARDAETILGLAQKTQARPFVTALGWSGAGAAIVPLMGFLRSKDEEVQLTAAYALDRITGAGLWEDATIDPEEIMVPDVPEPDVGEPPPPAPLAQLVSDPRDVPGDGAPERIKRPSVRYDRWRAWWQQASSRFAPTTRFRRGYPYTPAVSQRELDLFPCTPGERRMLQRELVARTGGYVRFDPHDFVTVQEESVKAWEPVAHHASSQPGSWTLPGRRS